MGGECTRLHEYIVRPHRTDNLSSSPHTRRFEEVEGSPRDRRSSERTWKQAWRHRGVNVARTQADIGSLESPAYLRKSTANQM
ncbi:hypothetical protein C8Q76DRAFT_94369 [Earliella scabrosa]|nr:hypothetical protein C8Q76DRAFT_94369 [Earliella scabrosa]